MIVFALFSAGCGEQNQSDTTAAESTGGTMTKGEVIATGDAACTAYRRKATPLVEQLRNSSDRGERAGLLRRLASAAEPSVQRLATVLPPPEGRQALDDYVLLGSKQVAVVRRAADQLDKGDEASAWALLGSALENVAKLRALAEDYGFEVCGSELDGS